MNLIHQNINNINLVIYRGDLNFEPHENTSLSVKTCYNEKGALALESDHPLPFTTLAEHQQDHIIYATHPCFKNSLLIAYSQLWYTNTFDKIIAKFINTKFLSEYSLLYLIPYQGISKGNIYNGPILHFNRSTEQILNFVSTNDACALRIPFHTEYDVAKCTTSHISNINTHPFSPIDAIRFYFTTHWTDSVQSIKGTKELILYLYMLKNAFPDRNLCIDGNNKSWPGEWKRYFQNLGIAFSKNQADDLAQKDLNTQGLDICKQILMDYPNIMESMNRFSEIIPGSLYRQFESSRAENKSLLVD